MSTSIRPAPLRSSIWDLPTTAISAPDKPMLYSDAVCIMNDKPSKHHLPEIAADLPDMLCHTTFPPIPHHLQDQHLQLQDQHLQLQDQHQYHLKDQHLQDQYQQHLQYQHQHYLQDDVRKVNTLDLI